MVQDDSIFTRAVRSTFYQVAADAIEQGLLTSKERDTISRRKTRKYGNWVRHLSDLCAYIEYRQSKGNHDHDTKRGSRIRQDATKRNSTG